MSVRAWRCSGVAILAVAVGPPEGSASPVRHLGHYAQPAFTIRYAHPGTDSAVVPAKHRRPGGKEGPAGTLDNRHKPGI